MASQAGVHGAMRITAWVHGYPPWLCAGGEEYLRCLLEYLADKGHEVTVVCPAPEACTIGGVRVIPEPARTDRSAIAAIAEQTDVVISQFATRRDIVNSFGKPRVHIHHNDGETPARAAITIANSDWVAKKYGSHVVLHPVVWRDRYVATNFLLSKAITLINTSALKGANLFFKIAEAMPSERFLAIRGNYDKQLGYPGRHPNVEFSGPFESSKMADAVYARTEVLVVPSNYESYGRVTIEAAANGIPVVASDLPGIREALGDAGIYCRTRESQEWVAAINKARNESGVRGPQLRERAALVEQRSLLELAAAEAAITRCGNTRHS